ncbi:terminus macrodomain insulation protein YfbV [Haemophilus paraphrohaemolyticus]|uniref:UPF0208 membrane protein YfbV n=1 Tax=Haemophilus paraphrohaemolyticus HK411 TaxID=1095743 RepID=I2NJ41_9PAST|nr:terminus macrodomain insulation protein YfbV [Haemophilus paraphrohaemolyticus]EIG25852.1 PF04217 family protein [Haemophilus paraphrohaemolyticus HK411]OOR94562.1 hypothetical protein B0184_06005 [Haemophilus paraphrohaemolyticus]STP01810.1 Uncharacterized protein conserved in bacteria [Haemophilus paraphrohaemolyticus]
MLETFQSGQRYLNTYPQQKKLNVFMIDYRLIQLIKFSGKWMPAFACFTILWQYFFTDPSQSILANSVITALFAVSIPYQGLYFLGKRSKSPLPLHLMDWYEELRQKLVNEKVKLTACPVQSVPSYQDFANLLQLAEKTWGNKYFDEL